ncbi:MAG TPA: hypothetical protein VMC09_15885 [Anaerolineales bacterium]|nr:hypothetical protein [Anaerolineales bacterium]
MKTRISLKALFIFGLSLALLFPFRPVRADGQTGLPAFSDFTSAVMDGQANIIRGVYVPGVLAYRVVQQPADNPGYVSTVDGNVTQFGMAAQFKVIGLLAHNNLAGAAFSNLTVGQVVWIVDGDGEVSAYTINYVARFQALQPESPTSNFLDLETNTLYSAQQVFDMFYEGAEHLTFQTCIYRDGEASWGRLFVTAFPNRVTSAHQLHFSVLHRK